MWKCLAAFCILLPLKAIGQDTGDESVPTEPKTRFRDPRKTRLGSSKAQILDDAKRD